jgi:hypothetical protein
MRRDAREMCLQAVEMLVHSPAMLIRLCSALLCVCAELSSNSPRCLPSRRSRRCRRCPPLLLLPAISMRVERMRHRLLPAHHPWVLPLPVLSLLPHRWPVQTARNRRWRSSTLEGQQRSDQYKRTREHCESKILPWNFVCAPTLLTLTCHICVFCSLQHQTQAHSHSRHRRCWLHRIAPDRAVRILSPQSVD